MFSHVVIFWTDPVNPKAADELIAGAKKYLAPLPGIVHFHVGKMVPNQRATIKVDAYPGRTFEGHVQSIGAGTGSEFSLLPAQNANGNWVKVTQRVPVRIVFEGKPSKPMIAGLSVVATVYFDTDKK